MTTARTAEQAFAHADEAYRDVRALERTVGQLIADEGRTAGKVDDLIACERKSRATLRMLVKHVQDLTLAVRGVEGMRSKLDSVSDLTAGMTKLEAQELARERRAIWLRKWGKRILHGLVIGAATCGGAALFAYALEACFGIHIPRIEVHP